MTGRSPLGGGNAPGRHRSGRPIEPTCFGVGLISRRHDDSTMSSRSITGGPTPFPPVERSETLRAIVSGERRRLLSVLLDRTGPVPESDLADALRSRQGADRDVPPDEPRDELLRLRHAHLPALVDAGLVSWSRTEGTVALTDHPGLRDPLVRRFVDLRASAWEDVIDALADPQRRAVVAALDDAGGALSEASLVREVVGRVPDRSVPAHDVEVALRHVHLPKLVDASLVEYLPEEGTVRSRDHPVLDGQWLG